MSITWTKKYAPKKLSEIQGQNKAVENLKTFILNYKTAKKKAVILYGSSGNGKTSSVYALTNEAEYEVLEINASDFRNKAKIEATVGAASKQMSLFMKPKLILVDELDGLSGTKDRGGIPALAKLVKESSHPIIITANNPYDSKFSSLRKVSELIEFHTLAYTSVFNVLRKICEKESISFDEASLKALARRAGGDLRGAITDLQTLCQSTKKLDSDSLDELGMRKQTESMMQALIKVFKTSDPNIALSAFDNVDEDIDKQVLWIDENLPLEYTNPDDLKSAYDKLSRADVFKGRIRRWQHWRFLVYISNLLTAGIAVSKEEKYKRFISYKPTSRILKLWFAKQRNAKKKAIAAKIAQATHASTKEVLRDTMPYLQIIFKKNKEQAALISEQLELDKDEVAWLNK